MPIVSQFNVVINTSGGSIFRKFEGDMMLSEEEIQAAENGEDPTKVGGARDCQALRIANGLEQLFLTR